MTAGCAKSNPPSAVTVTASVAPSPLGTPFGVGGGGSAAANAVVTAAPSGVSRVPSARLLASPNVGASPAASSASPAAPSSSAAPQFLAVDLAPHVVHSGDTVHWEVKTNSAVTNVSASVKTYRFTLQREAPGRFGLAFAIPQGVPWFFHGRYTLDLTASDAAGQVANTSAIIDFQ